MYPELRLLDKRTDRAEVWQHAQRKLFWNAWAWLVAGPVTVGLVLALHFGRITLMRHTPLTPLMIHLIYVVVLGGYALFASTFLFMKPIRRHIRLGLLARGVPVCLHCGYDLRAQTMPRCPECGTPSKEVGGQSRL